MAGLRRKIRGLILLVSMFLPWRLKRILLMRMLGFEIDQTAEIGFSWLGTHKLQMAAGSRIGHLNVFKGLEEVKLEAHSAIGRFNLFTCIPSNNQQHFQHLDRRRPSFRLGVHSRVTMRHLFDCNEAIQVGDFTTLAGYGTQYLSHSIDVVACRQDAHPIRIGDYCFVGTRCLILGGTTIPDCCVIAGGAVVRGILEQSHSLYAGVPATFRKQLPAETKYWQRTDGWIA